MRIGLVTIRWRWEGSKGMGIKWWGWVQHILPYHPLIGTLIRWTDYMPHVTVSPIVYETCTTVKTRQTVTYKLAVHSNKAEHATDKQMAHRHDIKNSTWLRCTLVSSTWLLHHAFSIHWHKTTSYWASASQLYCVVTFLKIRLVTWKFTEFSSLRTIYYTLSCCLTLTTRSDVLAKTFRTILGFLIT